MLLMKLKKAVYKSLFPDSYPCAPKADEKLDRNG